MSVENQNLETLIESIGLLTLAKSRLTELWLNTDDPMLELALSDIAPAIGLAVDKQQKLVNAYQASIRAKSEEMLNVELRHCHRLQQKGYFS